MVSRKQIIELEKLQGDDLLPLADGQVNIQLFKTQIQNKLNEINPIIGFYDSIIIGWNKRFTLASYLLNREESSKDKETLKELATVAEIEISRIEKATQDVKEMQVLLREKIQDLNILALRQSSAIDFNANIEIDSFKKAIYAADALLELRQKIVKEIVS
jgi:hypothetical protein